MRLQLLHPPTEVVRELCRQGHYVSAWCASVDSTDVEEFGERLSVHSLPRLAKVSPTAIRAIRTEILRFRPDVIQAFTPFALAWVNFAISLLPFSWPKPKVVSFRGVTCPVSKLDPANWFTYLHPRVRWHACESIAIQEAMVRSRFLQANCPVVYNCVTVPPSNRAREELRVGWSLPENAFVIGTTMTIRPVKGLDILLEALSLVRTDRVILVVIGGGSYPAVDCWLKHPKLQDRVRMLGFQWPASDQLPGLDAFVMPSRSEGLCRSLIEAMESGLPTIVSNAGGMKELVRHGIDGLVVPKEDPQALANAIDTIANCTDLAAMGEAGKIQIQSLCSAKLVASKLLAIYEAALEHRVA